MLVGAFLVAGLFISENAMAQNTTPVQKSENARVERKKELVASNAELEKKEQKYLEKDKTIKAELAQLEADYKSGKTSEKDFQTKKIDLENQQNNAKKACDEIKAERKRVSDEIKALE